jgi:hypothetical protein
MRLTLRLTGRSYTLSVALLLLASTAWAADLRLSGDSEVPPFKTSAYGNGTIAIAADGTVVGSVKTPGLALGALPVLRHTDDPTCGVDLARLERAAANFGVIDGLPPRHILLLYRGRGAFMNGTADSPLQHPRQRWVVSAV